MTANRFRTPSEWERAPRSAPSATGPAESEGTATNTPRRSLHASRVGSAFGRANACSPGPRVRRAPTAGATTLRFENLGPPESVLVIRQPPRGQPSGRSLQPTSLHHRRNNRLREAPARPASAESFRVCSTALGLTAIGTTQAAAVLDPVVPCAQGLHQPVDLRPVRLRRNLGRVRVPEPRSPDPPSRCGPNYLGRAPDHLETPNHFSAGGAGRGSTRTIEIPSATGRLRGVDAFSNEAYPPPSPSATHTWTLEFTTTSTTAPNTATTSTPRP